MTQLSRERTSFRVERQRNAYVSAGLFPLAATTAACPHPSDSGRTRWVQLMNLFEGSDRGTGVLCRISDDKGNTWRETGIYDRAYRLNRDAHEKMLKLQNGIVYDERAGVLVRFGTEYVWREGDLQTILSSILSKRRIYYSISFDGGETWTDSRYMFQHGGDYDRDRMFPGVTFGRNMIMPSNPIVVRGAGSRQGNLAVGVQIQMLDEEGMLFNPTVMGFFHSGCLFGAWNAELLRYEWTIGEETVQVPVTESTRGIYEPALCECDDGRIIMILRGSNTKAREQIPGTKWISVSDDQGATWSKPERLHYDDVSLMYSSSTFPSLVRDQAGVFYFVGMVNEDNPDGNLPRYPLCIAQLDTDTLTIVKESVTPIVTKQPQQDEANGKYPVDFSNQAVLWDEEDGKLIAFVPYQPDLNCYEGILLQVEVQVLKQQ
ncbi:sialidase family protein [Paenibacillus koleovorans]|uniref:sialidase family protein n=1 Tax=Paenibacillus koleovorans TaxID=121608 RepID=UPI000FDCA88C|nr:sialidase family protein [Paenibacillus koleovorans]